MTCSWHANMTENRRIVTEWNIKYLKPDCTIGYLEWLIYREIEMSKTESSQCIAMLIITCLLSWYETFKITTRTFNNLHSFSFLKILWKFFFQNPSKVRTNHCCLTWPSGRTFDFRSRCPWFESYTDLMWISLGKRNESPTKVWIVTLRGRCLFKFWYYWALYVGCKTNRERDKHKVADIE